MAVSLGPRVTHRLWIRDTLGTAGNATNSRFPSLVCAEGGGGVTTISIVVSLTAVLLRTAPLSLASIAVSCRCHNKKDEFDTMSCQ